MESENTLHFGSDWIHQSSSDLSGFVGHWFPRFSNSQLLDHGDHINPLRIGLFFFSTPSKWPSPSWRSLTWDPILPVVKLSIPSPGLSPEASTGCRVVESLMPFKEVPRSSKPEISDFWVVATQIFLEFSSRNLGKWSNLTIIFFRWIETTN